MFARTISRYFELFSECFQKHLDQSGRIMLVSPVDGPIWRLKKCETILNIGKAE
jgi:hypothetical protein